MSLTSNRISLKNIVSKIYRDLGITEEYDTIDLVEWSVEALRFINAFNQYEIKGSKIDIHNHQADLPCDLVAVLEVSTNGKSLKKASNNNFQSRTSGKSIEPYSYNLNDFESVPLCLGKQHYFIGGDSFIIRNGVIKTSFKEGQLDIKYNSIATDEEGIPLIPDDESYRAAIFWYVSMKHFYKKSIMEDRFRWHYQDAEMKWNKYCNQAGSKAMMPDVFTLENIKRNFLSFVPKMNAYDNLFNNLNE